jgi:carbonic anhydrase/acetyltransferase-like protein (isoleucine patch superfamily)
MIRAYKGIAPKIAASCYVDESAQLIGDVVLAENASVWMNAVLRGDVNSIRVGANSNVQDCSVLHGMKDRYAVSVGDWVTVGHSVTLHGCTVGNRCLIGMGSQILDDAVLQDEVLLGAGSLVTEGKILESGYLYVGRPAKPVRKLTAEERNWFSYSARHYVKLKDDYHSR